MTKQKIYLSLIIVIFIAIGISSSRAIFAVWQEPTAIVPPGANVDAPINLGTDIQSIYSPLAVGVSHSDVYGLRVKNNSGEGVTWAQDGFEMEQRSIDPFGSGYPDGRIWLRSNLSPTLTCSGSIVANASRHEAAEEVDLSSATAWTYSATNDTDTKCEYTCNAGYLWNGSACVIPAVVHDWDVGNWDTCKIYIVENYPSGRNVNGTPLDERMGQMQQRRTVVCRDPAGNSVANTNCTGGEPSSMEVCEVPYYEGRWIIRAAWYTGGRFSYNVPWVTGPGINGYIGCQAGLSRTDFSACSTYNMIPEVVMPAPTNFNNDWHCDAGGQNFTSDWSGFGCTETNPYTDDIGPGYTTEYENRRGGLGNGLVAPGDTSRQFQNGCVNDAVSTGYYPHTCAIRKINTVAPHSCLGLIPGNAHMYDVEEETGLTSSINWGHSVTDQATKCQFECNAGYLWNGSACIATTYSWDTGIYDTCKMYLVSNPYGDRGYGGERIGQMQRRRVVTCEDNLGNLVLDANCNFGTRPADIDVCTVVSGEVRWLVKALWYDNGDFQPASWQSAVIGNGYVGCNNNSAVPAQCATTGTISPVVASAPTNAKNHWYCDWGAVAPCVETNPFTTYEYIPTYHNRYGGDRRGLSAPGDTVRDFFGPTFPARCTSDDATYVAAGKTYYTNTCVVRNLVVVP